MSNKTKNLELHKWDLTNSEDLKSQFDIEKSLNENWDKIDKAIGNNDVLINALIAENKSYKSQIPLGTATGESITLNDSSDLSIESIKIEGNTYQESREGYNKIDIENIYKSENITITNNTGESVELETVDYSTTSQIYFKASGLKKDVTYTIICFIDVLSGSVASSTGRLELYDIDGTWLKQIGAFNSSTLKSGGTFTVDSDGDYYVRYLLTAGDQLTENLKIRLYDFMVYEGTEEKEYEQYGAMPSIEYPAEIESVTGDVEVKVQNKNIFNKETAVTGYLQGDGNIGSAETTLLTSDFIKIDSSKIYYLPPKGSVRGKYFDKNKEVLHCADVNTDLNDFGTTNANAETILQNIPSDTEYIKFSVDSSLIDTYYVVEGSTETNYIEHQEQNYPISLGEIELNKIGDVEDYIEVDFTENAGYKTINSASVVKNFEKHIFTGNETYIYSTTYSNDDWLCAYWKDSSNAENINSVKQDGKIYASRFSKFGYYTNILDENCIRCHYQFHVRISTKYLTENSVSAYQALLKEWYDAGEPLEVVYELAAPITTEITDETLLSQLEALINAETYKNITHIDTEGEEVNPIIELVYKKDLETLFNNLNTAVVALGGV